MCNNWPDFPFGVDHATGGLIGNTVIICGADKCYSLTSEETTLVTHMSVERLSAASIVINDNSLWVTGGQLYNGASLASTEYVTVTGTMLGPDLPIVLKYHAMVAINSTCSMVIGGLSYSSVFYATTFFYDHSEGEWIIGPSLLQERFFHAAGIVTDEVTWEHFVAVTGGYDTNGYGYFDSTEILQDGEWVQGKINDTICYLCPKINLQHQLVLHCSAN